MSTLTELFSVIKTYAIPYIFSPEEEKEKKKKRKKIYK